MIGSSAFSNWWLGLWLDKGSQVSFPLALGMLSCACNEPATAPFLEVEISCLHNSSPEIPFDFSRQAGHLDFYVSPSGLAKKIMVVPGKCSMSVESCLCRTELVLQPPL